MAKVDLHALAARLGNPQPRDKNSRLAFLVIKFQRPLFGHILPDVWIKIRYNFHNVKVNTYTIEEYQVYQRFMK